MSNNRISPLGWLGVALVMAIGLMVVFGVLSTSTYGGYYGMMGSGAWGWGIVMMAVPAFILVLVLFAALGGLGERTTYVPYPSPIPPPADAVEVLDQRYARGEVTQQEYQRIRADLIHAHEGQ